MHRAPIRMLLRLVHGRWPPPTVPTTAHEVAAHELVGAYDAWMAELRGLSANTRRHARAEAYRLLAWLHERGKAISALTVADVDAYLSARRGILHLEK